MYETSLRNRWNYISKHSLYSIVWKEEQTRLQNLPKKKKQTNKTTTKETLQFAWGLSDLSVILFSKFSWWPPDECLLSMRPCVLVTSSFTVGVFVTSVWSLQGPKCVPQSTRSLCSTSADHIRRQKWHGELCLAWRAHSREEGTECEFWSQD